MMSCLAFDSWGLVQRFALVVALCGIAHTASAQAASGSAEPSVSAPSAPVPPVFVPPVGPGAVPTTGPAPGSPAAPVDLCKGTFEQVVECVDGFSKKLGAFCGLGAMGIRFELENQRSRALRTTAASVVSGAGKAALNPLDASQIATDQSILTRLCNELCNGEDASGMNLCRVDRVMANAVAAAALPELLLVRDYAAEQMDRVLEGTAPDGAPMYGLSNDAQSALRQLADEVAARGATTGSLSSPVAEVAITFLQGLGRFVADRAKIEAGGWVLDRVGTELCGGESNATEVQIEIRTYWMPEVCTLAQKQRLSAYGGGEMLLAALQQAVETDLEHWTGAMASLAPAALYLDADPIKSKNPSVQAIRSATRHRVTEMVKGRDPLAALSDLSAEFREANRDSNKPKDFPFTTQRFHAAACGLGVPFEYRRNAVQMEQSIHDVATRARAAGFATLISVPACWDLIAKKQLPVGTATLTKIPTLFMLRGKLTQPIDEAWTQLVALEAASKELSDAVKALGTANEALLKLTPPALSPTALTADNVATLKALYEANRAGILGPAQSRVLRAIVATADAAVALGQAELGTIGGACEAWQPVVPKVDCAATFAKARERLSEFRRYIAIASEVVDGEWASTATSVLAVLPRIGRSEPSNSQVQAQLARHIGLLVAVGSAKTPDEVARALDAVASPPGSWRAKGRSETWTVSLTAHPGFVGGLEWRHGTYGATYEDGKLYAQLPALTLPVGIETAWGFARCISPLGFFISVVDPAAFLQYDADKDGRLPGASIKTALAPGVGLRIGVAGTPFSFIPQFVYRPGLRQWQADFSGTGADALQLGLLLGVDVTLFEFSRSEDGQ